MIPPGLHKIHLTAAETYREDAPGPAGEGVGSRRPRDTLLMFAGNVDFNWLTYSQGVRQRAFVAYGHKPGFDINDGYVNRALGHRCAAAHGHGHGSSLLGSGLARFGVQRRWAAAGSIPGGGRALSPLASSCFRGPRSLNPGRTSSSSQGVR